MVNTGRLNVSRRLSLLTAASSEVLTLCQCRGAARGALDTPPSAQAVGHLLDSLRFPAGRNPPLAQKLSRPVLLRLEGYTPTRRRTSGGGDPVNLTVKTSCRTIRDSETSRRVKHRSGLKKSQTIVNVTTSFRPNLKGHELSITENAVRRNVEDRLSATFDDSYGRCNCVK